MVSISGRKYSKVKFCQIPERYKNFTDLSKKGVFS